MNLDDLGNSKPIRNPATVEDVISYECDGPYKTKTESRLFVSFALPSLSAKNLPPFEEFILPKKINLNSFLDIDKDEESKLIEVTRLIYPNFNYGLGGLRGYFQLDMKYGFAGKEFHRIRKEIMFPITGRLNAKLKDVYGGEREIEIGVGNGLFVPPFISHTLEIKEESIAFFMSNTLFIFEHSGKKIFVTDTYSEEIFEKLKENYINKISGI